MDQDPRLWCHVRREITHGTPRTTRRLRHDEPNRTPFIWEDAADEYATLVNASWAGGFKTGMKTSKGIAAGEAQSFTQ